MEAALWPSTAAPARVVTDATERSAPKQKARWRGETVSPPPLLTLGRTHNAGSHAHAQSDESEQQRPKHPIHSCVCDMRPAAHDNIQV